MLKAPLSVHPVGVGSDPCSQTSSLASSGGDRPTGTRSSPATRVLREFDRLGARAGHENAGFLSAAYGFAPRSAPLTALSASFRAWDQLAAELPELHHSLQLRKRVVQLPLLDASSASLSPQELLRACALLAITAHAYWYVEPRAPCELPEVLRRPWAQARARLGRQDEVLSYIDLIVYNWRLIDPHRHDPRVVENLELLFPTVGNQAERVFYLTQFEILSQTSPVVCLTAAAQDAVLREDDQGVEAALEGIIRCLSSVVRRSLLKLDPNPYSATYVNPVVWAKTVAPLAVPFHAAVQGPSGTSSPLFNTLDLFFGRKRYDTFLGREIRQLRRTYPPAWQRFLEAINQVSVGDHVARSGQHALREAWAEAIDLYVGPSGFLGRHRMKVYGYLELAFKLGRSVTIGGFGGLFKDRTWDLVDNELRAAQAERPQATLCRVHRANVIEVLEDARPEVRVGRVVLDVSALALRYQPGDRCLILPENEPRLIGLTLSALEARGDELVTLTDEWKALAPFRSELGAREQLALRDVLRFGSIRPVSGRLAEALHARTQSRALLQSLVDGQVERDELWELLARLKAQGLDPKTLWADPEGRPSDRLCRLLPPLRCRVYSISSTSHDAAGGPNPRLELTVGQLRYAGPPAPDGEVSRLGTASTFLIQAKERGLDVPFVIERPDRFVLPEDERRPLVMFAGGTGISPFRAFLRARARRNALAKDVLFLSLRSPEELVYRDELAQAVSGGLQLELAFTRTGAALAEHEASSLTLQPGPVRRIDHLMLRPEIADQLWKLLRPEHEGGPGGHVYICGRSGFARTVLECLRRIFRRYVEHGSAEFADQQLYRLVGEGRMVQEIHSDARPVDENPRHYDLSEIALHNDAEHGYWMVIDRVVYDVTEFMEIHPGGRHIVRAYAGMDATHGFARAHHQRADVDAMRETYRIGVLRAHTFDDHAVSVDSPRGAVVVNCEALHRCFAGALQMVVEMQNAFAADCSLQTEQVGPGRPAEATPFMLARVIETHHRFLTSYLGVLERETLPTLWRLCQGLLFPEEPRDRMEEALNGARASPEAKQCDAWSAVLWDDLERFLADGCAAREHEVLLRCDAWFLAEMKQVMCEGLRAFEQHGARLRQLGAASLRDSCQHAARLVSHYYSRLARELSETCLPLDASIYARPPARTPEEGVHRLHTGMYWLLEEEPSKGLVVLRRTPLPLASLSALQAENERVLALLRPHHRSQGLVVDMRRAPLRNDTAFEDAMAHLRAGLTGHFQRTAVLVESSVGALQVERLERDERRTTLVTSSESSAFKFALGRS